MAEYNVTLMQDTGASLLLKLSNRYAAYSVDGVTWYYLGDATHMSPDGDDNDNDNGNDNDNDDDTPVIAASKRLISRTIDCGSISGDITHTLSLEENGITEYVRITNYSGVNTVNIVIPDTAVAQDTVYTSTLWLDTTGGDKELTLSMNADFCSGAHNQLFSGYSNTLHRGVTKMGITQLPNGKSFVTVLGYWEAPA